MAVDTANVWQNIELIIYLDPFSYHVRYLQIIKKARSKNPLKPKAPFKCFYGYYSSNSTKTFEKRN